MIRRVLSVRSCLGSDQRGFFLGTFSLTLVILLMYAGGVQASLSVGPGGDFPTLKGTYLCFFLFFLSFFRGCAVMSSVCVGQVTVLFPRCAAVRLQSR